jgi:tRNA U34 2-thiouridine synthase MnmA/TrmU
MKALSLLSGGLDSILATRIILDQNIDVEAVYFHTPFCDCSMPKPSCLAAQEAAGLLNIPFHKIELGEEFLDMVRKPKHGYGKNINPCIDCRILEFKIAKSLMPKLNASFMITGEVLNERPMSQRRNVMEMIDKEAGVEDLVLRPLSAKRLKETLPERQGWVEREKLLYINGRSRKIQIELAKKFNIGEYPTPSGGCLLTYAGFSDKVRDLIKHNQLTLKHAKLLKTGRHFRLTPNIKMILGKDEKDNERLLRLNEGTPIFLKAKDFPGPLAILPDGGTKDDIEMTASIVAYYVTKSIANKLHILYWQNGMNQLNTLLADKAESATINTLRITKN